MREKVLKKECDWHIPRSARRPEWLERTSKSEMRLERWGHRTE